LGWIQVAPYLDGLQDSFVWHRCGQRLSGLNVHPANHRLDNSTFQLTAPISVIFILKFGFRDRSVEKWELEMSKKKNSGNFVVARQSPVVDLVLMEFS